MPGTDSPHTRRQSRSRTSAPRAAVLEERRLQAAELFATGVRPAEVARRLGVSRQAASVWRERWLRQGAEALAARQVGAPNRVTAEQFGPVELVLLGGARASGWETDTWTLGRITEVIRRITGVSYHPGHVWRLLGDMGWTRQATPSRWVKSGGAETAA